jgi:hypothetical protein
VGDAQEPRTVILNTPGTTTAYLRLLQPPAVRRAELNQLNNLHAQAPTLLAITEREHTGLTAVSPDTGHSPVARRE